MISPRRQEAHKTGQSSPAPEINLKDIRAQDAKLASVKNRSSSPATPDAPEQVSEKREKKSSVSKGEDGDFRELLQGLAKKEGPQLAQKDEKAYSHFDKRIEQTEKQLLESNAEKESSVAEKTDLNLSYDKKLYSFWKGYFTKKSRARFIRHLKNGERYRAVIRKVFQKFGLPEDLFYVALIESGFNIHIKSRAQAVGPWQFISGTARRYGLRVENQIDERRNIIKATRGAARYFRDLYNIFGSWELALCAYNAGEYRIINAIRRGNTRDYNELVKKKLIPRETIYYIPKVAAARDISKNREKHNISVKMIEDSFYTNAELVDIERRFSLKELAKFSEMEYDVLRTLNPDLRWRVLNANSHQPIEVVLPSDIGQSVATKFNRKKPTQESRRYTYRVRSGDSLSEIARENGLSVRAIKKLNGLRGNRIYEGQKLKLSRRSSANVSAYRVKKGDNLSRIAKKTGSSVGELKRLNNLRGNRIYAGQKLKVRGKVSTSTKVYRVQKGDHLSGIAEQFQLSVSKLKRLNGISGNRIYIGQKLKVKGRAPASNFTYQVSKGDNLSVIADRFRVSMGDIKRANDLGSNRIYVGQKLAIPNFSTRTYVVKKGDNLSKIAKQFQTSIQRIVKVNNLSSRRIFPRQKLHIPSDS